MKITITPTDRNPCHNEVSVGSFRDDLTIDGAMALMRAALLAWGYAEQTVTKALGEFDEDEVTDTALVAE